MSESNRATYRLPMVGEHACTHNKINIAKEESAGFYDDYDWQIRTM